MSRGGDSQWQTQLVNPVEQLKDARLSVDAQPGRVVTPDIGPALPECLHIKAGAELTSNKRIGFVTTPANEVEHELTAELVALLVGRELHGFEVAGLGVDQQPVHVEYEATYATCSHWCSEFLLVGFAPGIG